MSTRRYTAAEIAGMGLPDLPKTKANIIARATSEGWPYEEKKGIGGTRRVYEVPAKYMPSDSARLEVNQPRTPYNVEQAASDKVAGAIAAGGKIDPEVLQQVVQTLEDWAKARRVEIPSDRKAALITVLYDYASKGANAQEIVRLLQAVG